MEPAFVDTCSNLRQEALALAEAVKDLHQHSAFGAGSGVPEDADLPEMYANVQLSFRHLEDARMRLGKAIQAYDGGRSCYSR